MGLATVAGIQAFEQGSQRANQDALTNTAVKIASDMQAQAQEPAQFGGEGVDEIGGSVDSTITLGEMGYDTESSSSYGNSTPVYETADGECSIESSGTGSDMTVRCESADAAVVVTVSSLDSDGIVTTTQEIKS